MGETINLLPMEETINAWMAQNKAKVDSIPLKVIDIDKESVKVEIGGNMIQVVIPYSLQDARDESSNNMNSDHVFLAICLEEAVDEDLNEAILALNEKLERIRIGPNSFNKVLDNILQIFEHYRCKKLKTSHCSSPKKEVNESEESPKKTSYLYKLAEEARLRCEEARSKADKCSIADEILPLCSVSVQPGLGTVKMEIEINGMVCRDNVTTALGFCFDSPLIITLCFGNQLWSVEEGPLEFFPTVEVSVTESRAQLQKMEASIQKVVDELDENMKAAFSYSCLRTLHQYGPQVLVPELVREFFNCSASNVTDDGILNGLGQAADSDNVFVGLLIFIGSRLSTLKSWCVICKRKLSPFSRLWYCEAELCLYRFEELDLGATVLQELQNSELIELELSLAVAASTSSLDVFEPYPTFLLNEPEIRSRSGFFSNLMTGRNIESPHTSKSGRSGISKMEDTGKTHNIYNKKLHLLALLINSLPPVAEMQNCENEFELRIKLCKSWLQKLLENKKSCDSQFSEQDYAKVLWLPYNVLRFVLFTNRLSLHLLNGDSKLNVPGSVYQFAVLYDSEREQYYKCCRATKRSVFAFHGSASGNWYSILRLVA
eukprot:Gb_02126 [translate_table: standard]